jgi:hypothetical protein
VYAEQDHSVSRLIQRRNNMKRVLSNLKSEREFRQFARQAREHEVSVWQSFVQQQQHGFVPDLVGGVTVLALVPSNAGASTITGTAVSVANITGKLLIVYSVGVVGGGTISCQIQSCVSGGGSNANIGSAFGTAAGSGTFQIDMETFTNTFVRAVVTIVTGSTPVSILALGFSKLA